MPSAEVQPPSKPPCGESTKTKSCFWLKIAVYRLIISRVFEMSRGDFALRENKIIESTTFLFG